MKSNRGPETARSAPTAASSVSRRESVSHRVRRAGLVLHGEVEAQQFADQVMLRDRGEALVEEVLEAVVVRLDEEAAPLEVWSPVADGEDEADQLPLVSG
jgi:hypothetical protein